MTWSAPNHNRRVDPAPLDGAALERFALRYVGRYATTRAKLAAYLQRKLGERGWSGEGPPPVATLVERFVELGYVDDRAFAEARAASFGRRGYGERRLVESLRAAGIAEADAVDARQSAQDAALSSALAFARRRRIGPFASEPADADVRARQLAAMMRAGHAYDLARRITSTLPGDELDPDNYP